MSQRSKKRKTFQLDQKGKPIVGSLFPLDRSSNRILEQIITESDDDMDEIDDDELAEALMQYEDLQETNVSKDIGPQITASGFSIMSPIREDPREEHSNFFTN